MITTVEESLDGFRRFTAELLRIKETETDPVRAFNAVKDWARRFSEEGVWPVLDHSKRDLADAIHSKFKETDVWTKFVEAEGAVADWLIPRLGGPVHKPWTLIRSAAEWERFILFNLAAILWHNLMDYHNVKYDGPAPERYPCLVAVEQRSCDTWPSWWEAEFVYEEDARALITASEGR